MAVLARTDSETAAMQGARNLLENCIGLKQGDRVLMVTEDPAFGYFDAAGPKLTMTLAREMGAEVLHLETQRIAGPDAVPAALSAAMEHVDHTIFFNRIGDQMRFRPLPGPGSKTILYAFDIDALGSDFATTPHSLFMEMLDMVQQRLDATSEFHITCPAGTDLRGPSTPMSAPNKNSLDFTLNLFPVTVHRPILCDEMSGKVVLQRWVTGTNTHVYDPEVCRLASPVTAVIKDGRLVDFEGDHETVGRLWRHYEMVEKTLNVDIRKIHSWHAGVNPRTFYAASPSDDPVRWHGVVFASPRDVHFHSGADYAPGEISWHVMDHTTSFDGVPFWKNGKLTLLQEPEFRALLDRHNASPDVFQTRRDIGL
ncbi:MAG: hypothetical protein RIM72_02135 [Alphaproteobacteria bacterium]